VIDDPHFRRAETMATLLDDAVDLPVVGRVGIDPLFSVVPVAGDTLTAVFGLYIVLEAYLAGVAPRTLLRMLLNVGVDWLFGSVPVLGTVFDVVFRANRRNMRLFERHFEGIPA
jgi:hypothetical protein